MATARTPTGTHVRQPGGYEAFVPDALPPPGLAIDDRLQALLSRADLAVGRLDGVIDVIPDPDRFVLMYVRREAVLSSQIEGTQASLMDVLEYEAEEATATARVDVQEIINYTEAMQFGLARLRDLPISRRLICEVHRELMSAVRGGEPQKTPGEFRKSQNWIGGASPASARFVPPPVDELSRTFAELESFIHDGSPMPALVKAALIHAQFETIHPFLDGNGRTGRLLITFWLVEKGVLRKPLLYPSLFFKEHREEYGDRLQAIREGGQWTEWLAFFLDGVAQVAEEAYETALAILALRQRDRDRVTVSLGRRGPRGLLLLDELLKLPIVWNRTVERALGVSQPTATGFIDTFVELGILREITGKQRGRVYAYTDYLALFPGAASRT